MPEHRLVATAGELKGQEYRITSAGIEFPPFHAFGRDRSYRVHIHLDRVVLLYCVWYEWKVLGALQEGDTFRAQNSEFTYRRSGGGKTPIDRAPVDYTQLEFIPILPHYRLMSAAFFRSLGDEIYQLEKSILGYIFYCVPNATSSAVILDIPGEELIARAFAPARFDVNVDFVRIVLDADESQRVAALNSDICAALIKGSVRFGALYARAGDGKPFDSADVGRLEQAAITVSPNLAYRLQRDEIRRFPD